MSNHVSNLDPPVLMPAVPGRMSILLKKGLMRIPILGTAMRQARFVPVERGSRPEAAKAMVEAAAAALNEGLPIVVFPEGTRSADGRLSGVQEGAVLSGDADGGADCAGGDLGDGDDVAQGKFVDYAGGGADSDAAGD